MALTQTTSQTAINQQVIDPKTGMLTYIWQRMFQTWQQILSKSFDTNGNLTAPISQAATVSGRTGTIGSILQNITNAGVVTPNGMSPATSTTQGAVIMAPSAQNNQLGTAAQKNTQDFDAAGSAAAAQGAATDAGTAAATAAQQAAQTFASDASNLTSGTVALARLPGISVTVATAALTVGGTQGSQTFTNGQLTAQVQAT